MPRKPSEERVVPIDPALREEAKRRVSEGRPKAASDPGLDAGHDREGEWTEPSGLFDGGAVLEGKFRIEHEIGRGAMGMVYLAWDRYLKRHVAVKFLLGTMHEPGSLDSFRTEAEAMASVRHHNVVQIFSFGEKGGHPYFVMEYMDGESLADLIERRREAQEVVHLDEAIGLLDQVCRGLGAIHKMEIVHRDVKPANILISSRYRVAVTDFGLVSQMKDRGDGTFRLHGTPLYMAPERIRNDALGEGQSHLCDIYATGVILYELLTGDPPFDADSVIDILDQHLKKEVPKPSAVRPELPPAIDDIVARAMAKDPAERFQTAMALREALHDIRAQSYGVFEANTDVAFVVIDRTPAQASAVVRILRLAYPNATVAVSTDGDVGLEFVRELRPKAVVMDARAPGMNALELCATLTTERRLKETRIIVLSPDLRPTEQSYLLEMGVSKVLDRPPLRSDLLSAIRSGSGVYPTI